MLPNIGEILLIAMPMTLLIIAGEIDLSVASIVGLSGVIFGLTYQNGLNIWLAAFLGVIVGVLCGAVNGILVARIGLGSLAVTIATLALYRGFATAAMGNKSVTDFPESWTNFGYSTIGDTFLPQTYPIISDDPVTSRAHKFQAHRAFSYEQVRGRSTMKFRLLGSGRSRSIPCVLTTTGAD